MHRIMPIGGPLLAGVTQVAVVLGISALAYGIRWLFFRKRLGSKPFSDFVGFRSCRRQMDKPFFLIWLALVAFGVVSTILQFHYSEALHALLLGQSSPYGKILAGASGFRAGVLGLIYCFVQASGSEEILYRGLIARRLYPLLGSAWGNVAQAGLFWLMHLVLFRGITGEWLSVVQLVAFVTSFGLGLIAGYANFRKQGESILPSWILHGSLNFSTFLTLARLWPDSAL